MAVPLVFGGKRMIGWIKEWWADIKAWWNQEPAVPLPSPPEVVPVDIVPEPKPDSLPTPIAAVLKKIARKK
jgi:hypothetical protein